MRPEFYKKTLEKEGFVLEVEAIVCPHCFQKDNEPADLDLDDDGDEEECVNCEHCGKDFSVKVRVEKTYTTKKVEDE